jgi:phage-related baseplate assembly protein
MTGDLSLIERDPETIKNELIASFEKSAGRKLYPADPWTLKLMWFADVIIQLRVIANAAALSNLLRFAEGAYLEALCEVFLMTARLPAAPAAATIRLYLSEAMPDAQTIPAGTRVGAGEKFVFSTVSELTIPPGTIYGDAKAECLTPGAAGNGFAPGRIKDIIDVYPLYGGAASITESEGGADGESDERLRERARLSVEAHTTAGSEGSYIYWIKSASQTIADVYPYSPAPCEVDNKILLVGGAAPGQELLDKALAAVNARDRRPLTDLVTCSAPDAVPFDVEFEYWLLPPPSAETSAANIRAAVEEAADNYILWQTEKMGRDIDPGKLTAMIRGVSGVKRARIIAPADDAVIPRGAAARLANPKKALYKGIEDE